MKIIDDKPWFAPKRIGIGAGLPVAWQGWAVLAVFLAGVAACTHYLTGAPLFLAVVLLVAAFGVVAFLKTGGGWRWR